MPAFKDITGQIFGQVRVNSRAENKRLNSRTTLVMWNCTCLVCGKDFVARGTNLKSGNTTTCGCTNKESVSKAQLVDLTGKRFGKLIVLSRASDHVLPGGNHKPAWNCKCDCGNNIIATSEHLTSGMTTSCGCYALEYRSKRYTEDLTNKRFGHLIALERVSKPGKRVKWKCICDCGTVCEVLAICLKRENTQSCGCRMFSLGAEKVYNVLVDNNISFKKEYTFKDLVTDKNRRLRFDFAIFDDQKNLKCLIEYQGQQHYTERINQYFGKQQREVTDQMKRNYCATQDIPLFEIRFDADIPKETINILQQLDLIHANPVPSIA